MVQTRAIATKIGTDTPPPSGKCLLLALPAELRVSIYEYVMSDHPNPDRQIAIKRKGTLRRHKPGSLVCTCRQIYNQARPLYFKSNTFMLDYGSIERAGPSESFIKMCSGWTGQLTKMTSAIRIRTRTSYDFSIDIDLQDGLSNYKIDVSEPSTVPLWYRKDPADDKIVLDIRRYFENLASKKAEEGESRELDSDGLIDLLELLSSMKAMRNRDFRFQAWVKPSAEILA